MLAYSRKANRFLILTALAAASAGACPLLEGGAAAEKTKQAPKALEAPAGAGTEASATETTETEAAAKKQRDASKVPFFEKGGLTELYRFPGPGRLTGVRVRMPDGRIRTVWLTADGGQVIAGAIFDAETGADLSRQRMLDSLNLWPDVLKYARAAAGIPLWMGERNLYVFADPDCVHCHKLYRLLQEKRALLQQAGIGVRWIPVAALGADSLARAAAILDRMTPEAVDENEAKFDEAAHHGGIRPLARDEKNDLVFRQALINTRLLETIAGEYMATPTLVVERPDGAFGVSVGLPKSLEDFAALPSPKAASPRSDSSAR